MQVPAPFEYERATSVDQAIGLLDRLGDTARLIAGGHSLLPMMKLRLANFEYLIDINDLAGELGHITVEPGQIRIGALTRHRELLESAVLAETFPIFADAERVIADPVVRNRGTIGGSLCQADPSEDLSAVCTTLGASCVIQGAGGRRVVTMEEFHRGPYETAVGDAEMLIEVRFPVRPYGSSAYEKVERRAGDWAVVSAGAAVWLADSASTDTDTDTGAAGGAGAIGGARPVIAGARVGLAAVGPNTTGLPEISRALRGLPPSEELYERAGTIAAASCEPVTDRRGSADYKRHLAKELTVRALRRSVARAQQARTNGGTHSSTGNGAGHRTGHGNGHPQGD
ncbi:FAD binding domain-containing protein [Streptomyces odonnellii]|uniref:FAD binding domain-containing protein n=1 Tax=Streptomyces odonnellii TaxID=1417980 RepID=UPI0006253038|nr:xanthine dehydrogenase family protein subunit M [Streptomyces odonnellii]